MIHRRKLPQAGDTRSVTKRAWWPKRFVYEQETVTIWLEQYVEEQQFFDYRRDPRDRKCAKNHFATYSHSAHWCAVRRLTLADACLEKLNPKPEVVVAQPVALPSWMQNQITAMQASNLTQLGGLGMPSQGFGQSVTYTKRAGTP